MPQLLSCTAVREAGSFSSHWTSTLVTAASQLHQSGYIVTDDVPTLCLLHLQARLGCTAHSSSSSSGSSSSMAMGAGGRGSLQLGDAACLALLAALLDKQQQQQQATLDTGVLQQLVSCAVTGLSSTGETHANSTYVFGQDASWCCLECIPHKLHVAVLQAACRASFTVEAPSHRPLF
jgi:hypothetical protein